MALESCCMCALSVVRCLCWLRAWPIDRCSNKDGGRRERETPTPTPCATNERTNEKKKSSSRQGHRSASMTSSVTTTEQPQQSQIQRRVNNRAQRNERRPPERCPLSRRLFTSGGQGRGRGRRSRFRRFRAAQSPARTLTPTRGFQLVGCLITAVARRGDQVRGDEPLDTALCGPHMFAQLAFVFKNLHGIGMGVIVVLGEGLV